MKFNLSNLYENLGGVKFTVFLASLSAYLTGHLSITLFEQITMAFMLANAIDSGTSDPGDRTPQGVGHVWNWVGGRKVATWIISTILLVIGKMPEAAWFNVTGVYLGANVLESTLPWIKSKTE